LNNNTQKGTVLLVDDDRGLLRLMEKALGREQIQAATADSGRSARDWLAANRPALMLLDLKLPDVEGKQLIQDLQAASNCPPFIIITGQGDERVAVEMMKRGAMDYLVKDSEFLQLVPTVVRRALDQLETQRRLAEAEQQVRLVRSVVEKGFSAVLIADADLPDPRVVYINPAFAQATGSDPQRLIGARLSSIASLRGVQPLLRQDMPAGQTFVDQFVTFTTSQGERWGEWRLGPVRDQSGVITHWLIIFRDNTERRRLEKEVLEISDRERQRIGQDLHDGICQHLAGIELMSQALEQKLAPKSKAAAARVGEIAHHVREAIAQTRALARGLSPVTLESEGLTSALSELANSSESLFPLKCSFHSDEQAVVRNPATATHLYRIAQEAVANAAKHGKATQVNIELRRQGNRLVLSIADNGSGLPPTPLNRNGMGLRIMHYRAGMIGGTLSIHNQLKAGTMVSCAVPIKS
jgi:PAS domain S-box-containing protein